MFEEVTSFTLIDRRRKKSNVTKKVSKVPKLNISQSNSIQENTKEILKFMVKWTKGEALEYKVTEDYLYNEETEAKMKEIMGYYKTFIVNGYDVIPIEKVIKEIGVERYKKDVEYFINNFYKKRKEKILSKGVLPIIVPIVDSNFLFNNYWRKKQRAPELFSVYEYKYFKEMQPYINKELTKEDKVKLKELKHEKVIEILGNLLEEEPFEEWSQSTDIFLNVWLFDRTTATLGKEDGCKYSIINKNGRVINDFTVISLDSQLAMLHLIELLKTMEAGFIDIVVYLINQDKPGILSRINFYYKIKYLETVAEAKKHKSDEEIAKEIITLYYQTLLYRGRDYSYKIKNTLLGDTYLDTFLVSTIEELYKEYLKEEEELKERNRASVLQTKKNITKEKKELMKTTRLLEDFKYVEIDNAIKNEDIKLVEDEWFTIRGILPKGQIKPNLRFRKLGNHKAFGMYSNQKNTIIIDNLASFLHEYGHYLDYYYTDTQLSKEPSFKDILRRYTVLYGNNYKKEYYTESSEVFARGFEHYLKTNIGLKSNFLGVREAIELDTKLNTAYQVFEEDVELNNRVIDYFNQLFTGENIKNQKAINKVNRELNEIGYLTVDKEKIINEVRRKLTKAEVEDLLIDFDNKIDMNLNPIIKVNNKKFEVVVGNNQGYLDLDESLTEEFNKYFNYAVMMQTPFNKVVEEVYKIFKIN